MMCLQVVYMLIVLGGPTSTGDTVESFVDLKCGWTPVSCEVGSRKNSVAFQTSVLYAKRC